jgi:nitrite reductase/ring-hydroxylating ferredoxin subunit
VSITSLHPEMPAPGTFICALDDIPDGGGKVFALGNADQPFRFIVLRSGAQVIAWHNRCPHLGAPLALKDQWLILKPHLTLSCNVHYARFRWQDGVCESGDCLGEKLTALPVEICNGEVFFGSLAASG